MLRIRYFLNLTVCFSIFSLTTVLWSQPDSWSFISNPSSGVFQGQATLDGVPAEEGDWSAAFDEDGNCAGSSQLIINAGDAYINLTIYGDDNTTPDVDEGMDGGENFTLKIWDSSTGDILEYPESFDCWYNNNGAPMNGCGNFAEVYNFHAPPIDPNFSVSLDADGGTGASYPLIIGFSPDATDGYDADFDAYAPPAPPPPAFDAALTWGGDRYYTQILNGSSDDLVEHEYGISLAYGTNNLIELTWDNTGWSDLMSACVLQDAFGGVLGIDVDMLSETSLTLDNPAFNSLLLKVTPQGIAYFAPSAFFTYSPEFPLTPQTITFSDASIAGSTDIVSWSWDFDGDGAEDSTGAGPHTYAYDAEGTYSATLTVIDGNELSDSYTASVTVALPVGPTAGFTYVVNQLAVSFTNESQAGDGAITGWSWDFGDDATSTEQNPVHVYPNTGTFTVSLTVTDEYDLTDTHTEVVQAGGLNIGPFSFYPNPSSGVFLGQVTLDGVPATEDDVIGAFDPAGNCAGAGTFTVYEGDAYIYSFSIYGDDNTTTEFDEGMDPGEDFTLQLWVSASENFINYSESFSGWYNNNGAPMDGYNDPYVVYNFSTSDLQPPVADFSGSPRSGDAPLTVQFMDGSTAGSGAITEWLWVFDVGGFPAGSQEENPLHTYNSAGVYTVRLTVTDANGLESVITQENYILVGTAGVNDAPLATDINVSLMEGTTILPPYGDYSFDADGDALDFSAGEQPEHGTVQINTLYYSPDADYYGFDSFTYIATDSGDPPLSDTATVFVMIIPVDDDAPVAVIDVIGDPEDDGFVETTEDVTLNGWGSYDVDDCPGAPGDTENCSSFQGSFQWSTVTPGGPTLQTDSPGYASFDAPEVEEDQNYTFSLQVTDGQYWSNTAFVTVTVQNNNAPVLDPIGTQYTTEASLSITLSATDYQENDPLTFSATSSDPDNVTIEGVVPSGDNSAVLTLSFTEEWNGNASVTAFVCDEVPSHCDSEMFLVLVEQLGVDDIVVLPDVFVLRQNYPNPFNPVTTIAYDIPKIAKVRIDMYNILGQKVRTLVNGTHQPGVYHIRWNGTNDFGNPVSSGMYFYRISSEEFISVKKLVLMK